MLRRAMDLGGFHQVIFICHTPLVWDLADSLLSVGNGGVFVGNGGVVDQPHGVSVRQNLGEGTVSVGPLFMANWQPI